jgi:hypothetical protein
MITTWEITYLETGRMVKNDVIQFSNVNSVNVNKQKNIADAFNNYFLTVAHHITKNNISNITDNTTIDINNDTVMHFMSQAFTTKYPYMSTKPTMTKEIENIIKALKSQNSRGYDEIPTKILKISPSFISSPSNYVCNETVSTGIFPDSLKYSIIKTLYKKGMNMMYLTIDQYHF